MFNRKEIKSDAKKAFTANYWNCVAVTLIISLITGGAIGGAGGAAGGANSSQVSHAVSSLNDFRSEEMLTLLILAAGVLAASAFIATIIDLFLIRPFSVGEAVFYAKNGTASAKVSDIMDGFRNGYLRNVFALFLRNLLIGLGSIVIIPGIILSYGYKMVPYILAEDPEISAADALRKSREMMKGSKWSTFVLELSFIGWDILSALTLGILGLFYVSPYKKQALAEVYLKLSGKNDTQESAEF